MKSKLPRLLALVVALSSVAVGIHAWLSPALPTVKLEDKSGYMKAWAFTVEK